MSYYSILGVDKSSSQEEIKSAYKKLVRQHHPDQGGDAELFKKINEAYDTLSDVNKRSAYDNPRPQSNDFTFDASNFEDIFGAFFNQSMGRRQARNKDVRLAVLLTLEEVLTGKDLIASYRLSNGETATANIRIHPGVEHGEAIRFKGMGDNTISQLQQGDLIVIVKVQNHNVFVREGPHLRIKYDISVFDLLLGTKIEVDTLTKKIISVNVAKGTQPNTTLSIAGYGLPDPRTGRTGNLYITLKGIVPKIENESLLKRITEINDEISSST